MNKLVLKKIGNYIDLITDYHSNGSYKSLKDHVNILYNKDYAIMIRTLNFERNDFSNDLIYVNKLAYDFLSKSKVYSNDILINKIANPGSIYKMPNLNKPVTCGMNLFLLRFNINQIYMYYLLKYNEPKIKSIVHGTSTKTITKEEIKSFKLFIHSDNKDQEKIANVLSALDDKIELNNRINKKLEEMARTIYDYWFLQFDFPNEEDKPYKSSGGSMTYNNNLKYEIPIWWKDVQIGDILEENESSNIQVNEAEANPGNYLFIKSGEQTSTYNDYIISGRNIFLNTGGNAGVKFYVGDCAYSTDTWCVYGKYNLTDYLYIYLKYIEEKINDYYFAGTGLQHLQKDIFKQIKLVIPDENTLNKFNEIVQPLYNKFFENERENRRLSEIRDFLLPMLMNGQAEVV